MESIFVYSILSVLFIVSLLLIIFSTGKYRRITGFILLMYSLTSIIYVHQARGKMSYSIGPLKATVEKGFGETKNFEINNPTDKNVTKEVKIASTATIDNLNFNKGNEFVSLKQGAIGKNGITYNLNMPPKSNISGAASTGGILIIYAEPSKMNK